MSGVYKDAELEIRFGPYLKLAKRWNFKTNRKQIASKSQTNRKQISSKSQTNFEANLKQTSKQISSKSRTHLEQTSVSRIEQNNDQIAKEELNYVVPCNRALESSLSLSDQAALIEERGS